MHEGEEEQRAMEARFIELAARWRLSPGETAALLDVDQDLLGFDLLPLVMSGKVEHRMRLLLEISSLIPAVCPSDDAWSWLRSNEFSFDQAGSSPLQFLKGPISNLRAFRSMLHHA